MIVRWPGKVAPASKTAALVEYTDVAPTFLAAAGLKTPSTMDGQSFLPVLLGKKSEHKKYTYGVHTTRGINNGSENFGIRSCGTKTHRYIRNLNHKEKFTNVVTRKGGDKADFWDSWVEQANAGNAHAKAMTAKYHYRPAEELYNVAKDPHCLKNLINDPKLAGLKTELSNELDAWMKSQGDQGAVTEAISHTRKAGFGQKKKKKQGKGKSRKGKQTKTK